MNIENIRDTENLPALISELVKLSNQEITVRVSKLVSSASTPLPRPYQFFVVLLTELFLTRRYGPDSLYTAV